MCIRDSSWTTSPVLVKKILVGWKYWWGEVVLPSLSFNIFIPTRSLLNVLHKLCLTVVFLSVTTLRVSDCVFLGPQQSAGSQGFLCLSTACSVATDEGGWWPVPECCLGCQRRWADGKKLCVGLENLKSTLSFEVGWKKWSPKVPWAYYTCLSSCQCCIFNIKTR